MVIHFGKNNNSVSVENYNNKKITGWKKDDFYGLPFWQNKRIDGVKELVIMKDFITTDEGILPDGSISIKKMKGYHVYSLRLGIVNYLTGKRKFRKLIKNTTKEEALKNATKYMEAHPEG